MGGTRLSFSMVMGPGLNGTARAADADPDNAEAIYNGRRHRLRHNMRLTVEGIKALAEETLS
jgi:hypothetical protein